ncbi:MAG: hypothetical protein NVS9B4_28480 [Candidatus Acidiferrum sp.]
MQAVGILKLFNFAQIYKSSKSATGFGVPYSKGESINRGNNAGHSFCNFGRW